MNQTCEAVLSEFAHRSGLEDIVNFSDIFSFVVFPDELYAGERLIKGINRHIDSEMSKTGTKKLTLPDEVDGVKPVSYTHLCV